MNASRQERVAVTGKDGARASAALEPPSGRPRWYWHPYNRAHLYRLAEATGSLPRPLRLALARGLGRLAAGFMPAEKTAIRKTLGLATGASGARLDALTAGVFRDFAMCFSDLVSTNRQPTSRLLAHLASVTGGAELDEIRGGVISVSAHVGNWELAGRLLARRTSRPTHVVVSPDEARELEPWVRRGGEGVRFVPRTHPGIAVELLAALRRGEVVALQGDRALGTRGDVWIPFFGQPAPFPLGPFLLARAAAVPVVPAFCLLGSDRRYVVRIEEPMTVARGEEEAAARRWVALLEAVVREYPTQWFNFFDAWQPFAAVPDSDDAAPGPGG